MPDKSHDPLAKAREDIASLERRLRQSQNELERQRQREEEILASTSWRITAPLRALIMRLRNQSGSAGTVPARSRRLKQAATAANEDDPEAGIDAEEEGALPSDATIAKVKSLIPRLPASCISNSSEVPHEANETYRLLDCSSAMESFLDRETLRFLGGSASAQDGQSSHYLGRRADPPAIAFLGSTELMKELAFDARVTPLREQHWQQDLVQGRFAFALIEPVWHVEHQQWRHALTADGADRSPIGRLLQHCHDIGLPVVAWYRGDADYAYFAWLAAHVDLAYATDEALAQRLRADHPGTRVDVLPVAVQPAIHNPVRPFPLLDASNEARKLVLFDGWWELVEGAASNPLLNDLRSSLRIAESEWDFGALRLADCPAFRERTLGCVDPLDRAVLGKLFGAEIFIDSSLLPAWRQQLMMLRSAAAGALVFQPGEGEGFLPGLDLPQRGEAGVLAGLIRRTLADPLQRARRAHASFRHIMSGHCVADRLQRIADDLRLEQRFVEPPPRIACLLVSMRPQLLAQCLERFRRDRYPDKELVVVLHGSDGDLQAARRLVRPEEPIRIFQMDGTHSLGACLNFAFAQTDAPFWTKVDDDDIYGPDYLSDLMLYQRTADAPLMGKPIAFVYFEQGDELHWVPSWGEQRSLRLSQPGHGQALLAGGSLMGRRNVLETVPFSERRRRGSDSDFLRRCHEYGHAVLATDCFNFALFRSGQPDFHTWGAGGSRVRKLSETVVPFAEAASTVFI